MKESYRPPIGDSVIHRDQQDVFFIFQSEQEPSYERILRQVEGLSGFVLQQPLGFFLADRLGQRAEIDQGHLER